MNVDIRDCIFCCGTNIEISFTRKRGMNPTLHADFGRATQRGLSNPRSDRVVIKNVRAAAKVF